MLMQSLKTIVTTRAEQSGTDALLGGLGFSAAVASACFAGYMVMTAPGEVVTRGGSEFSVFVPYDHRSPAAAARDTPAPSPAVSMEAPGVDFSPTGSIAGEADDPQRTPDTGDGPGTPLQDFAVRDVFDGTAMIEAHGRLRLVKPGTVLEGAGKVLAIQRKGSGWVVATEGGVIGQRH